MKKGRGPMKKGREAIKKGKRSNEKFKGGIKNNHGNFCRRKEEIKNFPKGEGIGAKGKKEKGRGRTNSY